MLHRLSHTGISISNMEKSLGFYRDLLGMKVVMDTFPKSAITREVTAVDANIHVVMLQAGKGNEVVELLEYKGPPRKVLEGANCDIRSTHVAFLVDNIHEMYENLSQKGVKFNCPPLKFEEGPLKDWVCTYLCDPDGYTLELLQIPAEQM
jgi:catechol 2,3-dioxygenase-like lactoylglutathione lyase family enzyme